ncbi:MAG: lysylphosphatidylglycerol synthase transmembrane domain-containing protein, partial [Deltaproteobacteria bacterium]
MCLIIWAVFYFDWQNIFQVLQGVKPFYLFLLFFIYIFDYLLRAFRWRLLLYPVCRPLSFLKVFHAYNFSQFANVFLPARSGELFRVLLINKEFNISKRTLLGTLLFERTLDVLAMGGVIMGVLYASKESLSSNGNPLKNLFFWGVLFIAIPFLIMTSLLLYKYLTSSYKPTGSVKRWIDRIEPVFHG